VLTISVIIVISLFLAERRVETGIKDEEIIHNICCQDNIGRKHI